MFNNSAIPITSNYVMSSFDSFSLYARIMSQYPVISEEQRRRLLISADNLENIRTKWQRESGKCITQVNIDILQKFGDIIEAIILIAIFPIIPFMRDWRKLGGTCRKFTTMMYRK